MDYNIETDVNIDKVRAAMILRLSGTLDAGSKGNADCKLAFDAISLALSPSIGMSKIFIMDALALQYEFGNGISQLFILPLSLGYSVYIVAAGKTATCLRSVAGSAPISFIAASGEISL